MLWNCCHRFNYHNCRRFRPGVEWRGWTLDYHRVYLCHLAQQSYFGDMDLPWIFHPPTPHQVPSSISRRIYQLVWVSSLRSLSLLLVSSCIYTMAWKIQVFWQSFLFDNVWFHYKYLEILFQRKVILKIMKFTIWLYLLKRWI